MTDGGKCIVCGSAAQRRPGEDWVRYDCERCGSFVLALEAEYDLPALVETIPLRRSLMSHALRRMQRPGEKKRKITAEDLLTFWPADRSLPTQQEVVDNLILWIGHTQKHAVDYARSGPRELAALIGLPITDDHDVTGLSWLFQQVDGEKFYERVGSSKNMGLRLTLNGAKRFQELLDKALDSRTAFMAMQYGDKLLQRAVEECFRPATVRTGFRLRILNEDQPAGVIDDQLRAALLSARLVIADLSHGNRGAYWEAGFGEGRGVPVIYTCEEKAWEENKTHFDTNHLVTIIWSANNLAEAQDRLVATIRATFRSEAKQTDE